MKLLHVFLPLLIYSCSAWAQNVSGHWERNVEACFNQYSDGSLRVSGRIFHFHESQCSHSGLHRIGQTTTYRAMLTCEGEGEKWRKETVLTVHQSSLMIADKDGVAQYFRCPAPRNVSPNWKYLVGIWSEKPNSCGGQGNWELNQQKIIMRNLSCTNIDISQMPYETDVWKLTVQCLDQKTNAIVDITGKLRVRTDNWLNLEANSTTGGDAYKIDTRLYRCSW